jgi:serine/threonine-protein kinase RsbT
MPITRQVLLDTLEQRLSPVVAKAILDMSILRAEVSLDQMEPGDGEKLLRQIEYGMRSFVRDPVHAKQCMQRLAGLLTGGEPGTNERQAVVRVHEEADILSARNAGWRICSQLGFSPAIQMKVATAISELARNIVYYAGDGEVRIVSLETMPRGIEVVAKDSGHGIANLEQVLAGQRSSKKKIGMGLRGTKQMVDEFDVQTGVDQGTRVTLRVFAR